MQSIAVPSEPLRRTGRRSTCAPFHTRASRLNGEENVIRRVRNREEAAMYEAATLRGAWKLGSLEIWWRDRQNILEGHGYRLRPRLRLGWRPSWQGTDLIPQFCEDSIAHVSREFVDATRMQTGERVAIKKIKKTSNEVQVLRFLTSAQKLEDRNNHCVPLYDYFFDNDEPDFDFIVMPLLVPFDNPPFYSVEEVMDFVSQTLEGIEFMHSQGIAHRDCTAKNIMMNADSLYLDGFHPSSQRTNAAGVSRSQPLRRSEVKGVRYYFIDFGVAINFDDAQARQRGTNDGQGLSRFPSQVPNNKFFKDVFDLGNVYRDSFIKKYRDLKFLLPVINEMLRDDPETRLTSAEVLRMYKAVSAEQTVTSSRRKLRSRGAKSFALIRHIIASLRKASRALKAKTRPANLLSALLPM